MDVPSLELVLWSWHGFSFVWLGLKFKSITRKRLFRWNKATFEQQFADTSTTLVTVCWYFLMAGYLKVTDSLSQRWGHSGPTASCQGMPSSARKKSSDKWRGSFVTMPAVGAWSHSHQTKSVLMLWPTARLSLWIKALTPQLPKESRLYQYTSASGCTKFRTGFMVVAWFLFCLIRIEV